VGIGRLLCRTQVLKAAVSVSTEGVAFDLAGRPLLCSYQLTPVHQADKGALAVTRARKREGSLGLPSLLSLCESGRWRVVRTLTTEYGDKMGVANHTIGVSTNLTVSRKLNPLFSVVLYANYFLPAVAYMALLSRQSTVRGQWYLGEWAKLVLVGFDAQSSPILPRSAPTRLYCYGRTQSGRLLCFLKLISTPLLER
jgi:hypothetical protein